MITLARMLAPSLFSLLAMIAQAGPLDQDEFSGRIDTHSGSALQWTPGVALQPDTDQAPDQPIVLDRPLIQPVGIAPSPAQWDNLSQSLPRPVQLDFSKRPAPEVSEPEKKAEESILPDLLCATVHNVMTLRYMEQRGPGYVSPEEQPGSMRGPWGEQKVGCTGAGGR
ncbi:MAG: hypothetical protein HQL63_10935 [Magnetococcales bacterium]|nr:hypothetical protein [Magnetococcales bacterium]MBF0323082.1 hypothetical protein [Magnetococcales bacterium]